MFARILRMFSFVFQVRVQLLLQLFCCLVFFLSACGKLPEGAVVQTVSTDEMLPAFPDAFGYGATATGGRLQIGSTAPYYVTRVDPDPKVDDVTAEGSFRWAVQQAKQDNGGTILFRKGGYITVRTPIDLGSNLTIAGQTAPGHGVVLRKSKIHNGAILLIRNGVKNVVVRYLKLRPGQKTTGSRGDGISVSAGVQAVMVDHVSIEWGHGRRGRHLEQRGFQTGLGRHVSEFDHRGEPRTSQYWSSFGSQQIWFEDHNLSQLFRP